MAKVKKEKQRQTMALFDISDLNGHENNVNNTVSTSKRNSGSSDSANSLGKSAQQKNRNVDAKSAKQHDKSIKRTTKTKSANNSKQDSGKKSIKSDSAAIDTSEIAPVKVGRKDRKHNWWPNCDYVWVDGIDHWIAKSAFRNEGKDKPVYTLDNYVKGLDSYWCLRYKPVVQLSKNDEILKNANDELKTHYKSWEDLSKNVKLSEAFIKKYKDHIRWTIFIAECNKHNRVFSEKFKTKFSDKFSMVNFL